MAAECFLFWNILKKDAELKWSEDHKKAFERINNQVKKEEVPHFKKMALYESFAMQANKG